MDKIFNIVINSMAKEGSVIYQRLMFKKCPFCAEKILSEAVKCKHCGEWLKLKKSSEKKSGDQKAENIEKIHPNAVDSWKIPVFSVITLGIYELYWFYKNWQYLEKHKSYKTSAGLKTIGLLSVLIPIPGLIVFLALVYGQFRDISEVVKKAGCKTHHSPLLFMTLFPVSRLMAGILTTVLEESGGILASGVSYFIFVLFLPAIFLAFVQETFNEFWKKELIEE